MWLKDWMEIVEYRITEGSDYQWECYGPNTYALDSWNGDQDGHSFTVIFDTKTQILYEVQAHDYKNQRAYRWINPEFRKKHRKESKRKNVLENQAWDDLEYVDLEVEDDWLDKAASIYMGEDYDTRVQVPVDFSDEELFTYMKMAHDRDMTLNALIEEALRQAIEEYKNDPEGMKQRAKDFKRG
jgi:hypothetical protein